MKILVLVLACLICGSVAADSAPTYPPMGSVGAGAQGALAAAFGGLSVPAIGLGALLWSAVVTSATGTTGSTGTK